LPGRSVVEPHFEVPVLVAFDASGARRRCSYLSVPDPLIWFGCGRRRGGVSGRLPSELAGKHCTLQGRAATRAARHRRYNRDRPELSARALSQKSRSSIFSNEGRLWSSTPAVQLRQREGIKLPQGGPSRAALATAAAWHPAQFITVCPRAARPQPS
jgi:hypothetical protein